MNDPAKTEHYSGVLKIFDRPLTRDWIFWLVAATVVAAGASNLRGLGSDDSIDPIAGLIDGAISVGINYVIFGVVLSKIRARVRRRRAAKFVQSVNRGVVSQPLAPPSCLSLEQTKSNLKDFESRCNFIQGHIPDVFVEHSGPSELSWLHIDLNSSIPTLKTLEQFVPKLLPGGVVLFDDYAHRGFRETKEVADKYCSQLSGLLLPLPTGQAVFFKH